MLLCARISSNLQTSCDSCGKFKKFDVNHAPDCKGYFGHSTTRHACHVSKRTCQVLSFSLDSLNDDRGDILIRSLWEESAQTIVDIHVTNLNSMTKGKYHPRKS
mmetsp:Transcript_1082/g.1441  ORF Transcript_1082/g.1441 Transcript_1082/m.1441 type:complete len:104 (-) Transcript_1082:371-682(-)